MMIRTVIVDDEPLAREGIRLLLQSDPEIKIVAECHNGSRAVNVLKHEPVDLVFLDVQMPGLSGFDVLARIPADRLPIVIFVTAYDHYALRAFKVHALDYLLKPFSDDEFLHALVRAKEYLHLQSVDALSGRIKNFLHEIQKFGETGSGEVSGQVPEYIKRIGVPSKDRISLIPVDEIDWIEAADYCVNIHVAGKTHFLRETLSALEARLDPSNFIRIHRSTIVRVNAVREIEPYFSGESVAVLHDGTKLKIGRTYRQRLKRISHPGV
ncbi:MAG TPA: LytTR family DNA-binding domain-containing protein [Bacteroidota bacterium]|jgi:two-component system LytT family response regulator|nr:LytTR family DNA-binding domain-containing protein [Bacteroidota bacterium]